MNIWRDEVNQEVLSKVLNKFFNSQPVVYDHKREGQIVEDGIIKLGPWAGPSACVQNLFHEMAHLVEIDTRRMAKWGWGLKFGKKWSIGGKSGFEFYTDQSVQREMRVWAIQANLIEYFEGSTDVSDLVSSATYLQAFCYYAKHLKSEAAQLVQMALDVQNLRVKYSIEWFESEWNHRMKLLNKRKEKLTSQAT